MILNIFNFARNNFLLMLQRIQTLYLLIADLLVALLFFVPVAEFAGKDGGLFRLNLTGVISETAISTGELQKSLPLIVLNSLIFLVLTAVIFQYKNRILQLKLSRLTVFLLLLLTGLTFYYVWINNNSLGGTYSLKLYFTFPLVAAVFIYLAIRGINKDEHLVRSIDRIR